MENIREINPLPNILWSFSERKYHSGTICKGVSNPQTSNAFTGCDKEEIPKCVPRRYRHYQKKHKRK